VNNDDETLALLESEVEKDFLDSLEPIHKRILGVLLALIAGILYGTNFDPPQYVMDNCKNNCSQNGLDYVFPHFCGIYITSTFYFLLYSIIKKNRPLVSPEVAYPGFLSGMMWCLADVCWFVANSSLKLIISFPIISIIPGVVASLWGILAYNEIKGRRNMTFFGLGFLFAFISVSCTVISKEGF